MNADPESCHVMVFFSADATIKATSVIKFTGVVCTVQLHKTCVLLLFPLITLGAVLLPCCSGTSLHKVFTSLLTVITLFDDRHFSTFPGPLCYKSFICHIRLQLDFTSKMLLLLINIWTLDSILIHFISTSSHVS